MKKSRTRRRRPVRRGPRAFGWALCLLVSAFMLTRVAFAPDPAAPAATRAAVAQLAHLERASPEVLGVPLQWGGRRSYGFGEVPLGEAFLAWATVVRPWDQAVAPLSPGSPFAGWRALWMSGWGVLLVLAIARLAVHARRTGAASPRESSLSQAD